MRQLRNRAFTIIELLTVIAITAILLTLIILPVFQSFNLVRAAQSFSEAQQKGRLLTERISREIGNAASVRNTGAFVLTTYNGVNQFLPGHSVILQLPGETAGTTVDVQVPYAKLDLVKPAEGDGPVGTAPNGDPIYRDPVTGFEDPTLFSSRGQVNLPVAPGQTMVRWFVGLQDPTLGYNNPYDGILMARSSGRDNLTVLYRAEIQPFKFRNRKDAPSDNTTRAWRPNLDYFRSDATDTQILDMDDPRFFLMDASDADKNARVMRWKARAQIQTEVTRYDMILPLYDKSTRKTVYVAGVPKVLPLIQFRPTPVGQDPAQGQVALRSGEEAQNAASIGPDVFQTQYGLWNNEIIRTYPVGYAAGGAYELGLAAVDTSGFSIFGQLGGLAGQDTNRSWELFDVAQYQLDIANQVRYPFTRAMTSANINNTVIPGRSGSPWIDQPALRNLFTPYNYSARQGRIVTSFGIEEVGENPLPPTANDPTAVRPNRPLSATGRVLSPLQANSFVAGTPYSGVGSLINESFNRVWTENPNLQPNIDRFIDLRVTPNEDGTLSPMYPDYVSGSFTGLKRARIVPGSETVIGPDQQTGPNYGNPVRYMRVTRNPGVNQYTINYVDQREPDYTLLGLSAPPANYTPGDLVSAVIQPRYKAGYIKLNSDPGLPLPQGNIQVSYRFQFTGSADPRTVAAGAGATDVFAVDYDSRQLMQVLLTIRNYAQSNLPNPQTITLKSTASIRNTIR